MTAKKPNKGRDWALMEEAGDRRRFPRYFAYNRLPAVTVDTEAEVPQQTADQADELFEEQIRKATAFRPYKVRDKQSYYRHLLHGAKVAIHLDGVIRYPRNRNHPEFSDIRTQVIDCAVEAGQFEGHRSPKGSPKMSRLEPTDLLKAYTEADPQQDERYVELRDRATGEPIPFDIYGREAMFFQARLEVINQVNALYEITCEPSYGKTRRLRPVHVAKFLDHFGLHGRMYAGRYGHTDLPRAVRRTIRFDGEPSVEVDFQGMHPRLLYHLEKIDYRGDPYMLWGDRTTPGQRLMAKCLINALINAESEEAAVAVCNEKMSPRTKEGKWKRGNKRLRANRLKAAHDEVGVTFKNLVALVKRRHRKIVHRFGHDWGVKLMRIDAAVAGDVLRLFAAKGLPCLSVHDSFVARKRDKAELIKAMRRHYLRLVGFLPVMK